MNICTCAQSKPTENPESIRKQNDGRSYKSSLHGIMQCIDAVITKFILRKESTRDHIDLFLSSKLWPLTYAVDMACDKEDLYHGKP